ncbi:unnamed protein product [Cuscuta europaea]|nr:unnamed protein product [Cuscuta europaea]
MGSLTPGWDSLVSDPKAVMYKRNKSLTKEEINSYWRSKKEQKEKELEKEEDHYHPSSSSSGQLLNDFQEGIVVDPADSQISLDKLIQTHGWWIKSNWAHLNEAPPPEEEAVHRYVSQFHVPNKASAATSDGSSSNHHLHA